MTYVDSHCHLNDPRLAPTLEGVLERARAAGIGGFVIGGVSPSEWKSQLELKTQMQARGFRLALSAGYHPWWVSESAIPGSKSADLIAALRDLEIALPSVQALGELGLDHSPRCPGGMKPEVRLRQADWFKGQLLLAVKHNIPVVIHSVRAPEATVEILQTGVPARGGIVHSFSGGWNFARQYLDLGLSLSISGTLAKGGFEALKSAVSQIPPERLLLETDSPDQPIDAGPGMLNEPSELIRVAKALAELTGRSPRFWLEQSSRNASRLFGI